MSISLLYHTLFFKRNQLDYIRNFPQQEDKQLHAYFFWNLWYIISLYTNMIKQQIGYFIGVEVL